MYSTFLSAVMYELKTKEAKSAKGKSRFGSINAGLRPAVALQKSYLGFLFPYIKSSCCSAISVAHHRDEINGFK